MRMPGLIQIASCILRLVAVYKLGHMLVPAPGDVRATEPPMTLLLKQIDPSLASARVLPILAAVTANCH
jgi:hypothetical protein